MVGAGFSKNAKPNNSLCSKFPDWAKLGDLFFEKVHGRLPANNEKYTAKMGSFRYSYNPCEINVEYLPEVDD